MKSKLLQKLNSYYYAKSIIDNTDILGYKPFYHQYYDIQYYGKPEIIDFQAPSYYPRELKYLDGQHVVQQPYYFFIEKAYLIKNTPFLIDNHDNLILESHGGR